MIGKTLTELIPGKGLPLSKFFEVAIPLADAIAAPTRMESRTVT